MKLKPISYYLKTYMMYFVLIALIIASTVITSMQDKNFLTLKNIINILNQNVYLLVIGVGVTFIMLSGALDLSVGFQISTVSVIMGLMAQSGMNSVLIILIGILAGVALSTINGLIYARLKIFPFMITLATQYILYGVSYLLSNSKTLRYFDSTFNFLGSYKFSLFGEQLPIGIIVMIVLVSVGAFLLNKTYFGRNVYALGSNPDAVALSGVSVAKMRIAVFAVAGFFFALGAILLAGRTTSVSSGSGVGAEFTVMAGAMLGGVKMGGGGGKMNNMVVGVIIIGLLNNVMTIMNWNAFYKQIALGVVLLLAITLDTIQTERASKAAKLVAGSPPPESAADTKETAGKHRL